MRTRPRRVPALLIVGDDDSTVLRINRVAATRGAGGYELLTIPLAGDSLGEPRIMIAIAQQARDWFIAHGNQACASCLTAIPEASTPNPVPAVHHPS